MSDFYYENNDKTFQVSQRQALSHHMSVSHFHSTYEIYYMLHGKRQFFIRDQTITIARGDLVIIAPNILHRTTNAEPAEHARFIINMDERLFVLDEQSRETFQPILSQDYFVLPATIRHQLAINNLVVHLIEEMRAKPRGYALYGQALAIQLLLLCCRYYEEYQAEIAVVSNVVHERMMEVVRYINKHYMDNLTLNSLSELFYVSTYYLSRSFKEATGFTIIEYINSVRVKEAKQLLEHSTLQAQVIAKRVGFGSVTHFGRVFKDVTGYAPLYYRKKDCANR